MKKILILGLVLLGLFTTAFAESDKIAYIDSDKVMRESADTMEAQKILLDEKTKWENEITEMDKEIEALYADYESKQMILTEAGKAEAENKIRTLTQERQQKVQEYFGENGMFVQKQNELLAPILQKMQAVIDKVAVENNYSMVLDVATGSVLYAKPSLDITDLIIAELKNFVE